jgi:hypothetical protein
LPEAALIFLKLIISRKTLKTPQKYKKRLNKKCPPFSGVRWGVLSLALASAANSGILAFTQA